MPFTIDGDVEVRDTLSLMKDLGSGIYGEVLRLKDNIISTQVIDGDIQIAPNGSGDVYLGLLDGNSQITNASNISISGNTITFPSSNTSDLIISTNGTTSAVKINNINISEGLITSNILGGDIEIRPNGNGLLKLGANLSLNQNYTSSYDTLSGTYDALSISAINSNNDGRHFVLIADNDGYIVMDQLGISNNILQNMNSSYPVVLRYSSSSETTTNDIEIDQTSVSILNSNGNPSFNLKSSSSDTVLTIQKSGTNVNFVASGFSFDDGGNSFLGASSSGIAVMKSGIASEALDVNGNIASSGNVVAGGNLVSGTGLYVTSGGVSVTSGGIGVTSGDITVSSGNLSVSSGNLTVSGTISDSTGVLVSTPWSTSGSNLYYTGGNIGIGTSSPSSMLDVAGNINFTGTLYKNGLIFTGDSQWTLDGSDIVYSAGKVTTGFVELENNVISSSENEDSLIGKTRNATTPLRSGYVNADGSSLSVYDYYHSSKVMDSYELVPSLSSNISSGNVVGNGTVGLIASYYKGLAWNELMKTVHDTEINYGHNGLFMSKVREYSGSFNRMFSVKWEGNLSLAPGLYDLIIDDAVFAAGQHTVTDILETINEEANQPIVDNENSWDSSSYRALTNGMRLPYLSEILTRRELGVDIQAVVPMFNDTGISDIDAYSAVANSSQWQYSAYHYVSITQGGDGTATWNYGSVAQSGSAAGDQYDDALLFMRCDCRLFDTRYIENDYQQPNMDENTNKGSWASKKRFAEAVGGRLPTIEEVRARKFLQCKNVRYSTGDIWVPCTNSAYDGQATDPGADYVQIGIAHYFARSIRDNEVWPNASDQWQTSDNFNSYETLTLVIFDNMEQSLSYNGYSIVGTNIDSSKTAVIYTKKYSITVPTENNTRSIEFKKNGQGPRQLLLAPQNGSGKRWLTPLDFSVSHSSVTERYKVFDGSLVDEFTSLNYIREPIGWVGTSKTVLDSVVLGAKIGSELFMPKYFDVEGTVDGKHWKKLKTFGAVREYSQKEFNVGSQLGCIGYRIVVIGTFMHGLDDVVKLAMLQFKTRGYDSFVVPNASGQMINLKNTDEDVYITSNSGVVNVAGVAFKENSLFVRKLQNETDIGRLIDWDGSSVIPEGYVVADGATYSGDDYPEAYKKYLEDVAFVSDIVPALKSNKSSSEGEVVTGTETVPNGLIAHCYTTSSTGTNYVYVKSDLVPAVDINNTKFNELFNISDQDYAALDIVGYLNIETEGIYTFYVRVDDKCSVMIDDEQLGYWSWQDSPVIDWYDLKTSDASSAQATKYLSAGYHKIRVRLWEIFGGAFIHLAMVNTTQGAVPVNSISDANIIPSSLFVPYLKEDYYKAFDKRDLLTMSPMHMHNRLVLTQQAGIEKTSMAIRSSFVYFYEYIGWYSSEAYVLSYFNISPYNFGVYHSYVTDFELQGSNDNSNWTTIQHYKNQTGSITNYVNPYGNGYRGYRVKVNATNNNTLNSVAQKMMLCGELGFYGIRFEDSYKPLPRNLVPVMTSNTTPRGVAIAGTTYSSSYDNWMAFDNNNSTSYVLSSSYFTGGALNEEYYLGWYDTSLSIKKVITGFSFYARHFGGTIGRSPVYFKLQGTLDGFTWYDIQTFTKTYTRLDNYFEHFVVSNENYIECNGFRVLFIAPNTGTTMNSIEMNFMQVWAFDHNVFNVPNVSGKLFKLYEGTSVLKLGKNVDAPYVEYDTSSLGTVKNATVPLPLGYVNIDSGATVDVEDYPEAFDKLVKVNTEKSLVPTLTSATSEGVVVSSGTHTNYGFYDWQAFGIPPENLIDKGVYHNSIDGISGSATVGWYNLELEKKKILRSFILYGRLDSTYYNKDASPKKFNIQGTNDGINWTTIETFSDVPRYRVGRRFIISPSNVSSSNAYIGFRIDILDSFTDSSAIVDSTTEIASSSNIKGTFINFIQFYCIDLETDVLNQPMVFSLVPRHDGTSNPGGTLVNSYPHDNNPPDLYGTGIGREVYELFNDNLDSWWETNYNNGFNVSPHEPLYIGWYNTSLSSKVILVSVFLHANYPRMDGGADVEYRFCSPVAFIIEGTIDGVHWYFVEQVSIPIVYTSYRYVISNRRTAYKGYRLVLKDPSYGKVDNWGTPATATLLVLGELDLECVNETDLYSISLPANAGKMMKLSNAAELQERLNDNLVEVGSLALDTLRGNNELSVGAFKKWNGVGYVPRGFAVMRGQKLGTLEYPKVFEALVDLQTPFLINPAMTSDTTPYGVAFSSSVYTSSSYYAWKAFDNVLFISNNMAHFDSLATPENLQYVGWMDTTMDKKKILQEFYMWDRTDGNTHNYLQLPSVFSVQGTINGIDWVTIQTYDLSFTENNSSAKYEKGVFTVEKENRHTAYYGFRVLFLNHGVVVDQLSFYVIDEPSKPIVLEPKPLVPNYTDWDNPSGNLVYSSYYATFYPWRAFNNDYVDYQADTTNNAHSWHAHGDITISTRINTAPYIGEYIGWYNTKLLKKKVLIYSRWTVGYDHPNRYNLDSPLKGFVQGTLDGINWETIHSFDTKGKYIEYYAHNNNRSKAYYGFRLYITNLQSSSGYVVLDSLQFMCLDEDEYFTFELPDSPDTLVNLERVQGIAVEGSIGTNSRGDGLSIVVDNSKDVNNALVVRNSSQDILKIRNDGHSVVHNSLHVGAGHSQRETLYYNYNGTSGDITFQVSMRDQALDFPIFTNIEAYTLGAGSTLDTISENTLLLGGFAGSTLFFYGKHSGTKRQAVLSGSTFFTGQHINYIDEPFAEPSFNAADYVGLIMVSTGKNALYKDGKVLSMSRAVDINDTLPVLKLSRSRNAKAVFGVTTNRENMHNERNDYDYNNGFCTDLYGRVRVNGVGEGGIWVCNINGSLENGDYITSCEIPGYGMKQDDDLLHNYTVAKITMDCDFSDASLDYETLTVEEQDLKYYRLGDIVLTEDNYYDLPEEEKKKYSEFTDKEYVVQRDTNGYLKWKSEDEKEVAYKLRYLLPDGTLLSKDEYNECLSNGMTAYIAAFVGCTYHCG